MRSHRIPHSNSLRKDLQERTQPVSIHLTLPKFPKEKNPIQLIAFITNEETALSFFPQSIPFACFRRM